MASPHSCSTDNPGTYVVFLCNFIQHVINAGILTVCGGASGSCSGCMMQVRAVKKVH